jgi:sortase A
MIESATAAPSTARHRSRRSRGVGVLGELLVTAGVLVLLFLGWQLWFNELVMGAQQQDTAASVAQDWEIKASETTSDPGPATPIVRGEPGETGDVFANLIVPRFGEDYYRPIAQGVGLSSVLNKIGIGHYPGTQMPGEEGNFAVAAHRTTYGRPFFQVAELRDGDRIYVETADGWYAYEYLSTAVVEPTAVEVIDPLPPGMTESDRYITLTTCHPLFSAAERMIVHGVFDAFYPRSGGIPDEIAYVAERQN